ncbi:hypothetical protein [Clostridium botulinum]|uniref:hypothetical protein n=1 Tax=Clostridium botulinum TaxID=1491 RepID=UPI0007746127|nr:hypothetical protein [Clostridium botulinum]
MRIIKMAGTYYCIMNQRCTIDFAKEAYMNKAKVIKGSFAERYTESIFNNMFSNSIDLKVDYRDFYKEEYSDFETFLYQKELFSKREIMDVNIGKDETLLKIEMDINSYNAGTLFEYENGFIDRFNQMLEGIDE